MASYFSYFPKVLYDLTGDPQVLRAQVVTDITKRVSFIKDLQAQASLYYSYTIKESDSPENIADRYYGDPQYFWVVLLFNSICDPELDWPKSERVLYEFMQNKYGLAALNSPHHYELVISSVDSISGATTQFVYTIDLTTYTKTGTQSQVVRNADGSTVSITTSVRVISNYDFETKVNEDKRHINILKKDYIGQLVNNLQQVFSN